MVDLAKKQREREKKSWDKKDDEEKNSLQRLVIDKSQKDFFCTPHICITLERERIVHEYEKGRGGGDEAKKKLASLTTSLIFLCSRACSLAFLKKCFFSSAATTTLTCADSFFSSVLSRTFSCSFYLTFFWRVCDQINWHSLREKIAHSMRGELSQFTNRTGVSKVGEEKREREWVH